MPQEVKVLNLVNHGSKTINETDLTSAMINEWTSKGWRLHTITATPWKISNLELPVLIVVLVREVNQT